jgi:hypothetical protein
MTILKITIIKIKTSKMKKLLNFQRNIKYFLLKLHFLQLLSLLTPKIFKRSLKKSNFLTEWNKKYLLQL